MSVIVLPPRIPSTFIFTTSYIYLQIIPCLKLFRLPIILASPLLSYPLCELYPRPNANQGIH